MERVIKFRAWEPQYKMMSPVTMLLFTENELDCEHNNGEPKNIDHFVLMQFTGKSDDNGKEIYEGDIVSDINNNIFEVQWNDDTHKWQLSNGEDLHDGERYGSTYFVIGNIHENPNLIK